MGGRKHHAVRHRDAVLNREASSLQRSRPIQIYDPPLLHDRNGSQRIDLASLLGHALEYLK